MVTKKHHTKKNRKTIKNSSQVVDYLNSICKDSHYCISFGIEQKKINNFFDDFVFFTYAISPVKTINVGCNGIIKKIIYERYHYKSYAIIKFSLKPRKDSILYEYLVGCFLNQYTNILPSFIHTYGLYKETFQPNELKKKNMSVEELKSHLQYLNKVNLSNPSLELGCIHSLGLLLEHIQPYITLDTVIEHNEKYPQFFKMDIITILYQLYFTLFFLSKKFTHYDLHLGNVLLYKPSKNGYINFIYHHQNNEVTSFKSQYVVKIIDYGRCFFQDENISSYSIYKKLCEIKKCEPDCGDNYGFGWLNSESTASNYFVNSQKINVSHDLRFLYELNRKLKKYGITNVDPSLKKILSSVLYGVEISNEKNKRFGTKEINESNQSEYEKLYPHKIKNVMEAKEEIQKYVFCDMTHFKKLKKIGDLHIFENGDNMRYIPY